MPRSSLVCLLAALAVTECLQLAAAPALQNTITPAPRLAPPVLTAAAATTSSKDPYEPPIPLLMLIAGLQSACFGCIGTALPPALRAAGLTPAEVAILLGRLGSASALCEVLLSGSFGKLADAFGRKPILLAAPLITVLARSLVVVRPTLPVLLGARMVTTLVVPMYWLAYQASMADVFGRNSTKLAILGSRVQAGMGLGYAISSYFGGPLAARDIRYAYAASCSIGCCVLACVGFGLRETLPDEKRVRFVWKGSSPLAFTQLFRRGALSAKLNLVVVLQSLTNGMGDLWQVTRPGPSPFGTLPKCTPATLTPMPTLTLNPGAGARAARVGRCAVWPLRGCCGACHDGWHAADGAKHSTARRARAHGREHGLVGRGLGGARACHLEHDRLLGRCPDGARRGKDAGDLGAHHQPR